MKTALCETPMKPRIQQILRWNNLVKYLLAANIPNSLMFSCIVRSHAELSDQADSSMYCFQL